MRAYILNSDYDQISDAFIIDNDADFDEVELEAKGLDQKCCIKWDRASDGQSAYWSPSGAVFEPHWYNID